MHIFLVMPVLSGCFGFFCIPLMIGVRYIAFPFLTMLSFWVTGSAGLIMRSGFFVEGGHAAAGWTSYAPLSAVPAYTGVNWGQNIWCISLFIMGVGSMMGSINYITTIINMRAPGMQLFRMPLVVWSLFITAILLLLALPVLTSGVAMLLFDRTLGTSWFRPSGGGEPLLWQHLFWYFGHPEFYCQSLPAMGIPSEILPVFCRKPIFGYHAMAFSMIGIAFLSWIVYGHHMFVSGMSPALGMAFTVTTMIIAVPSAIKTFNWLGTLWGARIQFTVPMLNALAFVSMFVIGGLSGIFLASPPVAIYIPDTPPFFTTFWGPFVGGKRAPRTQGSATPPGGPAPPPPPHLNWGPMLPTVHRGPYEYSSPESKADWLPQNAPPVTAAGARRH